MFDDILDQYSKEKEPEKYYKSYAWKTAIGLQDVDGLETSSYLIETAEKNINGNISFDEAHELISSYYKENKVRTERTEEADKVSVRIAQLISESSFTFSPVEFISIHKRLFTGIFSHAGIIRPYNITKKEWVLNGASVVYGSFSNLRETLEYDFSVEKKYDYKNRSIEEIIAHIARFISNLWQIHIFCEGNTRTTAVFLIKYLKKLGFDVTNDIFAENSWYFRNALIRANYNNRAEGIIETTEYLELFLRNLLLNEESILSNREMHIAYTEANETEPETSTRNISIFKILEDNPTYTLQEVADSIGKSLRTVKIAIKSLQEQGLLTREGGKKNGRWIVQAQDSPSIGPNLI